MNPMAHSGVRIALAFTFGIVACAMVPVTMASEGVPVQPGTAGEASLAADVSSAEPGGIAVDTLIAVPPPPVEPARKLGLGAKVKRAAGNLASDGWAVAAAPFRVRGMGLAWVGAGIGATAVLYANDQEILDAVVRNRRDPVLGGIIDVGTTIEPVGFMGRTNPYYFAALGTGYLLNVGVLRTLSTEIIESHFLAGGVRNVLKVVVGRQHPTAGKGPYAFEFAKGTSFPSGHTSVAFELATIASMNAHSLPISVAAYSAATAIAVQRVESLNHWPSDVFVAAVYGTLVSRMVVRLHESRTAEREGATTLLPRFSEDGRLSGMQLSRRF